MKSGQVVVLDNLSAHKERVRAPPIERAGCTLLFLPPCSPDLNPIEPAWSKLKALLRGVGACTLDALHAASEEVCRMTIRSRLSGHEIVTNITY